MIGRAAAVAVLLALVVAPFVPMGGMRQYVLHVVIQIFIWSFIGGAWSLMGRFGLVSLGHGAFLGVGAYTTTLLWNFYGLTPWIGTLVAMAAAIALALIVAYPCSRFGIIGHYFALVTLAVGGVVYAQYSTYVNPETLAGIGVSLRIVFAVVLGGMYSWLGPTVGTALTITLQEYLRVKFGLRLIGMAETIYGLLLVVFIIFLPAGIYGSVRALLARRRAPAPATA